MPGPDNGLLDVDGIVSERLESLSACLRPGGCELARILNKAHSLPAAPGRSLEHDWISDIARERSGLPYVACGCGRAGNNRHPCGLHDLSRSGLDTHRSNRFSGRADELDARASARFREVGVLAQESVAGVDRIRSGLGSRPKDSINVQVALCSGSAADRVRFVSKPHVLRHAVDIGIHRNARNAHFAACPHDPHGDLAAIGNQYFPEHERNRDCISAACGTGARLPLS